MSNFFKVIQAGGRTWDLLSFVNFLSQLQRLRLLGDCAPHPPPLPTYMFTLFNQSRSREYLICFLIFLVKQKHSWTTVEPLYSKCLVCFCLHFIICCSQTSKQLFPEKSSFSSITKEMSFLMSWFRGKSSHRTIHCNRNLMQQ